jgi:hypothetical protein
MSTESDETHSETGGQMHGWFVEGPEELGAVKDLDAMSDRAAAIVVATLVELRLSLAIRSKLRQDEPLVDRMFRPSGPLGSFGSKIDLAFLMDLVGKEAHRDLSILKAIRNDFAHQLVAMEFTSDKIASQCGRFKLIETQVADIEDKAERCGVPPHYYSFFLHVSDYHALLAHPRGRYILTARLFVAGLDPKLVSRQPPPWI